MKKHRWQSVITPSAVASACVLLTGAGPLTRPAHAQDASGNLLTGQAAFTDYSQQQPGVRHKISVTDLPAPNPAEAVDNGPSVVPRPADAWPTAPPGFKVTLYAGGDSTPMQRSDNKKETTQATEGTFVMPRLIRFAPTAISSSPTPKPAPSSSSAA